MVTDPGTSIVLDDIVPFEKLVDTGAATEVAAVVEKESSHLQFVVLASVRRRLFEELQGMLDGLFRDTLYGDDHDEVFLEGMKVP